MRKGSGPPSHGALSPGGQRDSTLRIAIVDESPIRAAIIEEGLREAGFSDSDIATLATDGGLIRSNDAK